MFHEQEPWGELRTEPFRDACLGRGAKRQEETGEKFWPAQARSAAMAGVKLDPRCERSHHCTRAFPHTCRTTLAGVAQGQEEGPAPGPDLPSLGSLSCPAQETTHH